MRTLYTYFRSSAAYRVRVALALKGLEFESIPIHLARGEQRQSQWLGINPLGLVPALAEGGHLLTQSLAIIEYLDEICPSPPLLPPTPLERARVRAIAQLIACEIHPLNNLRVLNYLKGELAIDATATDRWYRHWVETGLAALEKMLTGDSHTGRFCHGDSPTLADCALVPQIFNARRFNCSLAHAPTVVRIAEHCGTLEAFRRAEPAAQPDAE